LLFIQRSIHLFGCPFGGGGCQGNFEYRVKILEKLLGLV
jgi:hypothetical protein